MEERKRICNPETGVHYSIRLRSKEKPKVLVKSYKRRAKGKIRKNITVRGHYRSLPQHDE